MNNTIIGAIIIGVLFAVYKAIQSFLLTQDIKQASAKTTLLQTIIDAKNTDITKDEEKVKEASDVYEDSKSNYDSSTNKPK